MRMRTFDRRDFLRRAACGTLGLAGSAWIPQLTFAQTRSNAQNKPNIVFFLIDDLGWTDVGYNGSTFYETPHIDRLATQGMVFNKAYAACPLCSPTRASIMTGKSPARLHLTGAIPPGHSDTKRAEEKGTAPPYLRLVAPGFPDHLPLEEMTIAEVLKQAGYVTGFIGKWHLGGEPFQPEKQGFDFNFGGGHYPAPPSYFYPYRIHLIKDGRPGEYLTDRLTDEAERFLESNKDNPFFLFLSHYGVHGPFQAKDSITLKYRAKDKPLKGQNCAVYASMIQSVDESLGRVMAKLDELNLSENTVVIFFSDNGGLTIIPEAGYRITSNAPLRGGKGMIYEGGIREPMIVRWQGVVEPGSVCEEMVITDDFLPTLCDIADVKLDRTHIVDGESIVPLLKQTGSLKRDAIHWHFPHYARGFDPVNNEPVWWNTPSAAIRQGDHKLIQFFEGRLELYDLRKDIGETHNLASEMPQKAEGLRQKLNKWLKGVDAWMPIANPEYDPSATLPPVPERMRNMMRERMREWGLEQS